MSERESQSAWKTVHRRKPYPNNWRHAPEPPTSTNPFTPYQPSFAQMVKRSPPNETLPPRLSPARDPLAKQAASNASGQSHQLPLPLANLASKSHQPDATSPLINKHYTSHHTKPALRFPPSPTFPEWRGRCFRCCQRGHTVASCRNPTKCGRCWRDGHIGGRCKQPLNHTAQPFKPSPQPVTEQEPTFDELLEGNLPYNPRPLPHDRPAKTHCYINRDEDHQREVAKLSNAVVLYAPDIEFDLCIDKVAEYAAMTKLVGVKDVSVGILTRSRYLIHLPKEVQLAKFIKALPDEVWELGFSFSQWSPASDTRVNIPKFKVLLDLVGIPAHLSKEEDISKAISAFGVYLGTVEQCTAGDLACWTVAIAVT